MVIWKLVSGILSITFSLIVTFQSCAAGLSNILRSSEEVSGTAGMFVAIFMLSGGIISIVSRRSDKKGGNIALIILFGLACLFGFTMFGSYSDLVIWSVWCFINLVMAIISLVLNSNKKKRDLSEPDYQGPGDSI